MSDLKNQIFTLLKKCPNAAGDLRIHYYTDSVAYTVSLISNSVMQKGVSDCYAIITISTENDQYQKNIELTEKEYMDLKWTIEEWDKELKEKAFEDFAKFAESEPNSMDDLLND